MKSRDLLNNLIKKNKNKLPAVKTIKSKYPLLYQDIVNGWNHPFTASSFAEMTYNFLDASNVICDYGNRKKYESFSKGYISCSKTCKCAVEKKQKSMLDRHGVTHALQSSLLKEKVKNTFLKKYGVEKLHQINIEQKQKTNLKRYGAKTPLESSHIREKTIKTFKKKYGYSNNFEKINSNPDLKQQALDRIRSKQDQINAKRKQTIFEKNPQWYDYDNIYNLLKTHSRLEVATKINSSVSYIDKVINDNNWKEFNNQPSYYEVAIEKLLESIGVSFNKNDRFCIAPKELDFFVESHNIAIEFNGLRWHGEKYNRGKKYHFNKMSECQKRGIKLIQIFQDEWDSRPEVVRDIIMRQFCKPANKYAARQCTVKKVDHCLAKDFYDAYHLQGNIYSKVNYGLYFNDRLISMMSFKKSFKCDEWELTRYCNMPDVVVIGGAQKLFKNFIKDIKNGKCFTYSDNRWFAGDVYRALGFTYAYTTQPNYWYTLGTKRYHRLKFTKKNLIKLGHNKSQTEKQIMKSLGYDIIWDCGNKRWEIVFKNGDKI
jgi:hypothetical protein